MDYESSPDPLGQPDLSSPLYLNSRSGSGKKSWRRSSASKQIVHRKTRSPGLNLATPSPEPPAFQVTVQSPSSGERKLLSPWRPQVTSRANGGTHEADMDQHGARGDTPESPEHVPAKDTITTTVPLKTGDETPKRRKKRRTLTPKRRRRTPAAYDGADAQDNDGMDLEEEAVEEQRSPTPRKRVAGKSAESLVSAGRNQVDQDARQFGMRPPENSIAAPGASPGKRRRVVSNGDTGSHDMLFADTSTGTDSVSRRNNLRRALGDNQVGNVASADGRRTSPRRAAITSQDPTNEHDEFDSILESEDFTMVSLSSIPSGQQLRSLTRGGLPPRGDAAPTRRSPRSNVLPSTTPKEKPPPTAVPVVPISNQPPNTPYGNGLLAGFSPATRRELRAGLRLGQELAKRSVQAKKAAAQVQTQTRQMSPAKELVHSNVDETVPEMEEITTDVFADLAAAESSHVSSSSIAGHILKAREPIRPRSSSYMPFPKKTVGRSDENPFNKRENSQSNANNEMSWKFDTPAKSKLGLPATRGRESTSPRPVVRQTPEKETEQVVCGSSPDKQLFMEQAAAVAEAEVEAEVEAEAEAEVEVEAAEIEYPDLQTHREEVIHISSNEPDSDDSSSDEDPPEMSDATKSILADETFDIWQTEAEASNSGRGVASPKQRASRMSLSGPEIFPESGSANEPAPGLISKLGLPRQSHQNTERAGISTQHEDQPFESFEREADEEDEEDEVVDEEISGEGVEDQAEIKDEPVATSDVDASEAAGIQNEDSDVEMGEDIEVEDEPDADAEILRGREERSAHTPSSPYHSSPPPPKPVEVPKPGKTNAIEDLYPPKRSKLPSLWRRQSDEPVVYSDEPELPPAEHESAFRGLGKRQRTYVTPDARKKGRYNDADFSVLSEFKGAGKAPSPRADRGPPSSPLKRVRFESEDPENPYLPTTPVQPIFAQIEEEDEEEGEEGEEEVDEGEREDSDMIYEGEESIESPSAEIEPVRIRWEEKSRRQAAPKQGSWLSGLLPSWFKAPSEPIFSFSLPNLLQLRSTSSSSSPPATSQAATTASESPPAPSTSPEEEEESYEPQAPPASFSTAHYAELKRLYQAAQKHAFPLPRDPRIKQLLGWEINRLGWRKRVNHWELGIIAEFLRPDNPLAREVTPEQVARRLFSIWAVEVQKGKTGLGRATAGLFSTKYVGRREEVLARARRKKSLAAS